MNQSILLTIFKIITIPLTAFMVVGYGVIACLLIVVSIGFIVGNVDVFFYLRNHWRAVGFVLGSELRNLAYKKIGFAKREQCVRLACGTTSHKKAIIIPGTWSRSNYSWDRWRPYIDGLLRCGYEVYGLHWNAPNDETERSRVADWLCDWLTKNCSKSTKCVLIGHSYGGQVAALCGNHPAVTDIVSIATPFIHIEGLDNLKIANNALAAFTRAVWLAIVGFGASWILISKTTGTLKYFGDCYQVLIALFIFCCYIAYIIYRMISHIRNPKTITGVVTLPPHVRTICVSVEGDPVVKQLAAAAQSKFTQLEEASAFLEQRELRPEGFKKWALPFYLYCVICEVLLWIGSFYFPKFQYLTRFPSTCFTYMASGAGLFFSFIALVASVSVITPRAVLLREMLLRIMTFVSWKAVALDNRRFVVSRLAGLHGFERWIYAINITDTLANSTVIPARLCGTPAHAKHSNVISDPTSASMVTSVLCSQHNHKAIKSTGCK